MHKCVTGDAEVPPEQPAPVKKAYYEALRPSGADLNLTREILLAGYFDPSLRETPAQIFAEARKVVGQGLRLSPNTLVRLSGPRNVFDSIAPGGSQWRTAGTVVMSDSGTASSAAVTQTTEPATSPAAVLPLPPPTQSLMPITADRPSQTLQPASGGPAWLNSASPPDAPSPSRSRRGNLLNIFQDAMKQ